VLKGSGGNVEHRYQLQAQGFDFEKVFYRVSELLDMNVREILLKGKQSLRVKARSLVCWWVVKELGMTDAEIENLLGLTRPAVSELLLRKEKLALGNKFCLADKM
jgi:hypothetical protein